MRGYNYFLIISVFLTVGCQSVRDKSSKLHNGPSGNTLREKYRIPVIDSYMVKLDTADFIGFIGEDRWESKELIPIDGKVLHAWKSIYAYNEEESSVKECDGLRVKVNDSVGQGLNICSILNKKSIVTRSGELFTYSLTQPDNDRLASPIRLLNENEIDSVLKSWHY